MSSSVFLVEYIFSCLGGICGRGMGCRSYAGHRRLDGGIARRGQNGRQRAELCPAGRVPGRVVRLFVARPPAMVGTAVRSRGPYMAT